MKYAALALIGVALVAGIVRWFRKSTEGRARAPRRVRFKKGQVWTYRTRLGEEASRLTILKVERFGKANVVHVHISHVAIRNAAAPGGTSTFISHMPFAEEAVGRSVARCVDQAHRLPAFEDGYAKWIAQAGRGKAGVFTISVAEAIAGIENAFQGGGGGGRSEL